MAILLTLLMFLLFITISYYRSRAREAAAADEQARDFVRPPAPQLRRGNGFDIPRGYHFHPGHTWVLEEGGQNARIGLDGFAADLVGKIDRIEAGPLYRWVRQGQKIWTVSSNDVTVDMLSPVEGVVVGANPAVLRDPSLIAQDPYGEGWILLVKSPDIDSNLKNLVRGPLVRTWMQDSLDRLKEIAAEGVLPLAQDGGLPLPGALSRVEPEIRDHLIEEFFLTSLAKAA